MANPLEGLENFLRLCRSDPRSAAAFFGNNLSVDELNHFADALRAVADLGEHRDTAPIYLPNRKPKSR